MPALNRELVPHHLGRVTLCHLVILTSSRSREWSGTRVVTCLHAEPSLKRQRSSSSFSRQSAGGRLQPYATNLWKPWRPSCNSSKGFYLKLLILNTLLWILWSERYIFWWVCCLGTGHLSNACQTKWTTQVSVRINGERRLRTQKCDQWAGNLAEGAGSPGRILSTMYRPACLSSCPSQTVSLKLSLSA